MHLLIINLDPIFIIIYFYSLHGDSQAMELTHPPQGNEDEHWGGRFWLGFRMSPIIIIYSFIPYVQMEK